MTTMYLVDDTFVMNLEDILSKYITKGNWKNKHTNLIKENVSALSAGQKVIFRANDFIVTGEDEEGEWIDRMPYPKSVQCIDETVREIIRERNNIDCDIEEVNQQIKTLLEKKNSLEKALRKNQGNLQRYANAKA